MEYESEETGEIRQGGELATALFAVRLQHGECFLDQLTAYFLLFFGRHAGVAYDVNNTVSQHNAIGADHFSDR